MTASAQCLLPQPQQVEWQRGRNVQGVVSVAHVSPQCLCSTSPEAYRLRVTRDSIVVYAATPIGELRARQTLAQLRDRRGAYRCVLIDDAPAYEWRGAMIDVSRHFFPIEFLRRQVDVLSAYKINRLHLHLTDAAGWRMEIKAYPRLTSLGAWRRGQTWKQWWWECGREYVDRAHPEAYGGYYTQDELRELVAYAAARGVTIVPEIEMPAHSEEVLTAYPELSCTHEPYRQADFCIGNPATYVFLQRVLEEVMDVFPSTDIHIGGDEAGMASWGDCPLCQAKMRELGLTDKRQLQASLIARIGKFLSSHGRRLIGWDEIVDASLPAGATVMVWRDMARATEALRLGLDVVLSPSQYCYLDAYQDAPPTQPEAMGGFTPLSTVYDFIPDAGVTAEQRSHLRGVQGNLWTEYVPTSQQAEYMLYPRMLAIAEVGWNGTRQKDWTNFRERAKRQAEALRAEGINAFDLGREVGNRKAMLHPVSHKARGAKVTYNAPYAEAYRAAGDTTLTDGRSGGWHYADGRWQGFIEAARLDVTLDLGREQNIKAVSTHFFQSCAPEIFFPAGYEVSVSRDGRHFTPMGRDDRDVVRTDTPDVQTRTVRGRTRARYVRVKATAGDQQGWVFADEIEVH